MKRTVAVLVVILGITVSACGDDGLLSGLGERGHDYVQGSTTIVVADTSPITASGPATAPVEKVSWWNQGIEGESQGDPALVVPTVWSRRSEAGRFIQASPAEIALALPGVGFPSLMPEKAKWVTSQLVYDAASATLDPVTSAAFGVWSARPYTDRGVQLAVLRVGQALSSASSEIRAVGVDDGVSLSWTDGLYEYELFCVTDVTEPVCTEAAASLLALQDVAPPIAVTAEGG